MTDLRPNWRDAFGPGDFKMPVDPPPTLTDFNAALAAHQFAYHEDSEDLLNSDGTWGPTYPYGYGGSGIAFGYSSSDLDAVLVAEQGCYVRQVKYDWDHWIRQIRYAIAAWEMTHDTRYARRIVYYDSMATGAWTDDPATIHLHDPGWIPWTLAQVHAMAQDAPGTGIPPFLRMLAWVGYGKAMRLKVDRKALHAWPEMLLETCALAAQPGTGQIGTGITSTFHEALLIHAVLCLCHRMHLPTPQWIFDLMHTIQLLPRMNYYDESSPVRFWRTVDGVAVPEAPGSQPQQGDPAFGYWSTNCVALRDPEWLAAATLIGPTENTDENSRKLTMLLRGVTT